MATVFHRTRKEDTVDFISKAGFSSGPTGLYGQGVYTTYNLGSQMNDKMLRAYGPYLIKAVVNLSSKFLIFDPKVAKQVYKKDIGLDEQLESFGLSKSTTSKKVLDFVTKMPGIEKKVSGLVFTGATDGNVVVVYDPKLIIPVSWVYADEDYMKLSDLDGRWSKISSYQHLRKSLRAIMNRMQKGSRDMRHVKSDPDWDGAFSWIYGMWEGGIWDQGVWLDGLWKTGTWKTGVWHSGTWLDGRWKNGVWLDGTWSNGIWYDGVWHSGTWLDGTWQGGTWIEGFDRYGILRKTPPNTW